MLILFSGRTLLELPVVLEVIKCVFSSFGILLWEIWCRTLPFNTYSFNYEAADAICRGERPPVPSDCSSCYVDLMKQCWSHNKGQRPDFVFVLGSLERLINISTV